jgi:hypothetical protein
MEADVHGKNITQGLKFRLAEEELEVSYIDSVKLEVELKNGTGMSLQPTLQRWLRKTSVTRPSKRGTVSSSPSPCRRGSSLKT